MTDNFGHVLLSQSNELLWIARLEELGSLRAVAGLFRGWVPAGFHDNTPRILYVGKATSGKFDEAEVERKSFNIRGAFWAFACQIAAAVGCSEDDIPCIAWSNISKVSYPQIAAEASLIAGFEQVAASTLESDIAATNPDIVVFVSAHFSDRVVELVSQGYAEADWNKSEDEADDPQVGDVWWRRRSDNIAVLWMRHPMGASMKLRQYAAAKIALLAGSQTPAGK